MGLKRYKYLFKIQKLTKRKTESMRQQTLICRILPQNRTIFIARNLHVANK